MEYLKRLNLYVDWSKGRIYRRKEKGFFESLLSFFGGGDDYEDVTNETNELRVKKYKFLQLYTYAKYRGKTSISETLNGKEVKVNVERYRVVVETPDAVVEYTPEKFTFKDKKTGKVEEKKPTLTEFYEAYKEILKLLGVGSVSEYLKVKAREPSFKRHYRDYGSAGETKEEREGKEEERKEKKESGSLLKGALLGLGGGMALGYLLGSAMGESFAKEVETAPPLSEEEIVEIEEIPLPEELEEEVEGEIPETEATGEEPAEAELEEEFPEVLSEDELPEEFGIGEETEGGEISEEAPEGDFTEEETESFEEEDFADAGDDFSDFDDFGGDFDV